MYNVLNKQFMTVSWEAQMILWFQLLNLTQIHSLPESLHPPERHLRQNESGKCQDEFQCHTCLHQPVQHHDLPSGSSCWFWTASGDYDSVWSRQLSLPYFGFWRSAGSKICSPRNPPWWLKRQHLPTTHLSYLSTTSLPEMILMLTISSLKTINQNGLMLWYFML